MKLILLPIISLILFISSLQAQTQIGIYDGTVSALFQIVTGASKGSVGTVTAHDFGIYTNNTSRLNVGADGTITIGNVTIPAGNPYKLYVESGILTEKVKIALKTTTDWSDYVFAKGYRLAPLEEVERFISGHGRLPEAPSAKEVVKEGIDVAKTEALLLKKVEELTLYLIEMNKKIEKIEAENKILQDKLRAPRK